MARAKSKAKNAGAPHSGGTTKASGKRDWTKVSAGVVGLAALSSAVVTLDDNLSRLTVRWFGGSGGGGPSAPAKTNTPTTTIIATTTTTTTTTTATSPSANGTTTVSRTQVVRQVTTASTALPSYAPGPSAANIEAPSPPPPEPRGPTAADILPAPPPPSPPPPPPCALGPFIVFFDWDRSQITTQAAAILDNASAADQECDQAEVVLAGHADRSGSETYNVELSQRRADSVRDYLVGRGITGSAITTEAFGESRPLVETADGVREPHNRRVEVNFSPSSN